MKNNNAKHTPFPWILRGGGKFPLFIEAPRREGQPYGVEVFGEDYGPHGGDEQREADIRFAFEACTNYEALQEQNKELLEALKEITEDWVEMYESEFGTKEQAESKAVIKKARAAIAKAEGRLP